MKSVFVDSNVVVYSLDRPKPERRAIAQTWLKMLARSSGLTMSPQVLNESYATLTLKLRLDPEDVRPSLRELMRWVTAPLDIQTINEAWAIQSRYGVRIWDGLLLAAANLAGCSHFLSEDLNDGQLYGAVQAVNPFRHQPEDVLGPALSR